MITDHCSPPEEHQRTLCSVCSGPILSNCGRTRVWPSDRRAAAGSVGRIHSLFVWRKKRGDFAQLTAAAAVLPFPHVANCLAGDRLLFQLDSTRREKADKTCRTQSPGPPFFKLFQLYTLYGFFIFQMSQRIDQGTDRQALMRIF